MTQDIQISPHFFLSEFLRSQEAARRGIDNTPSQEIINALRINALKMEEVRWLLGKPINISSGYRCPELNAAIGGAKNSAHMTGFAADFEAPTFGSPLQVCKAIEIAASIIFDQLIHEFGTWTHIGWENPHGGEPRRQVLTIDSQGARFGLLEIRK